MFKKNKLKRELRLNLPLLELSVFHLFILTQTFNSQSVECFIKKLLQEFGLFLHYYTEGLFQQKHSISHKSLT